MTPNSRFPKRESPGNHPPIPVPPIPTPVPTIREAVPTDSQVIPNRREGGSRVPSIGGNREPHPGNQPHRFPLSRTPQTKTCRTCGQTVITALDADRAAITATLDPYPLTAAGEVWALQHQRPTYLHTPTEITRRDRWNIPGRPPTTTRTVLAWHQCGQPIPTQHRRTSNPQKPHAREESTTCPF